MVQKTEFRKTTDKFGIKYVNQYRIGKPLGQGTSSRVVTGTDDRGNQRALKIFSKARLRKQSSAFRPVNESVSSGNRGQTEILHLSRLGFEENAHINIIKLYEVMDDPSKDNMALVLQLANVGEITSWDQTTATYSCKWQSTMGPPWIITEDVARSCFTQIAAAVNHLHSHMLICHRDIKPSNMLIHLVNGHPQVLLSDFGVAQSFADTPMFTDIMGTYPFIPPEACSGEPYDGRAADIWALGVTLYSIVFGKLPFYHQNLLQLFQLIENCDLDFPLLSRDHPVLDLLANILLNKNPHKRQMDKILSHPWLQS